MKNKIFGLGALAIASALFAFTEFDGGVIKGKVTPAEAVQQCGLCRQRIL